MLLPVFFFLHGARDAYGAVQAPVVVMYAAGYLVATAILLLLFQRLIRGKGLAALLVTGILTGALYWGDIIYRLQDRFSGTLLARILPLIICLTLSGLVLVWLASRLPEPVRRKINLLGNLTLVAWCLLEGVGLIRDAAAFPRTPAAFRTAWTIPQKGSNWNVYFLLFDEYAGSSSLRRDWDFDNSGMDSFLARRGFSLQPDAKSNYNYTHFSMASMLNGDYLNDPRAGNLVDLSDYRATLRWIRQARVVRTFRLAGYSFRNYSIFDIAGQKSDFANSGLAEGIGIITGNTFPVAFQRDVLGAGERKKLRDGYFLNDAYNKRVAGRISSKVDNARPVFVYGHFLLPHFPFYYDSLGHLLPKTLVVSRDSLQDPAGYRNNVREANRMIRRIVADILEREGGRAAIVICGDHGFRRISVSHVPDGALFSTFHAVYFPDRDYKALYPGISAVNTFRVVLNKVLGTQLPILPDRQIRLDDQQKEFIPL